MPPPLLRQAGAIPYRLHDDGALHLLLITSRSSGRWIIPKGMIDPGLSPIEAAAVEALEEAGVEGPAHPDPLGTWTYTKWGHTCRVELFLLCVTHEHDAWDEDADRQRRWATLDEAALLITHNDLRALILRACERLLAGELAPPSW